MTRDEQTKPTQQFLERLGNAVGNMRLKGLMQPNDELYRTVHAALEDELYGSWHEPEDGEQPGYNPGIAAFFSGWQAGRHGTANIKNHCPLPMCGCSMGEPDGQEEAPGGWNPADGDLLGQN